VNIAQRAGELGKTPKEFVDENVAPLQDGGGRPPSAPTASSGRAIRTTFSPAQEMVRRAYAKGDI